MYACIYENLLGCVLRIIKEVEKFQFEQVDDMTLIVMKKLPD